MATLQPRPAPAPQKPVLPRARPYKDYLTPALHRAFTNAALAVLIVCWIEAWLLSNFSLFWSWFPLGINGIRTSLLFITCLVVFLLRLTNLHLGRRTYTTAFEAFWRTILSSRALFALLWYYMSAFLFSEVYIFSTSANAKLGWIDVGKSYERARLNERAVIFRAHFVMLALVQAAVHLYFDFDALLLPFSTRSKSGDTLSLPPSLAQLPPLRQLQLAALPSAVLVIASVLSVALVGPIIYFAVLRQTAWNVSYSVASTIYTLAKSPRPPGLESVWALFGRFLCAATLLSTLWQISNLAFTVFGSQEPLKKDRPLTDDSKDPNGSLANGLKVKKPLPKSIALWELQIISDRYEVRRRSIYNDFEKPSSTSWADVVSACVAEIERISRSVREAQAPPKSAEQPAANLATTVPPKQRIAQPLRDDQQVLAAPARPATALDALANGVGAVAKGLGQSHNSSSPLANRARALITAPPSSSPNGTASRTPEAARRTQSYVTAFLRTPAGAPFRATHRRRVNAIVFGSPFGRAADLHHAVQAVSKLVACSLTEDNFGQVQRDIARVLSVLVAATRDLRALVATLPPHWTDVFFRDGTGRRVPEVEELLVTLGAGIELIVLTFGEYGDALGISRAELRAAKDLVGADSKEMVQRQNAR